MATVEYKCPNCAAPLIFDAEKQKLICEFCDSTFDISEIKQGDTDQAVHQASKIDDEYLGDEKAESYWREVESKTAGYVCPTCGGSIIGTEQSAALFCPYCGNPAIIQSSVEGEFKPDCIIPFKTTREDAVAAFNKFCGKKFLLPKEFDVQNAVEKVTGIYLPYHLLSCKTSGNATYTGAIITRWEDADATYEKYDYYDIKRAGTQNFRDVPSDASKAVDDDFCESIEPFDKKDIKDFDMSYLSGFLADKYDATIDDCFEKMKKRVSNTVFSEMKSTVTKKGYSEVVQKSGNVALSDKKFKYALFPVWLLRIKFQDEFYYFAMNGQTGKYAGRMPISQGKLVLGSFGWSLLGGLLGALFGLFFYESIGLIGPVLGALIFGSIAYGIGYKQLPKSLRNVNSRTDANYYVDGKLNLTLAKETFKYTRTYRHPKPKNND